MPQTRISQDVWDLGQEVAAARGLGSARTAIEAIVRVYARAYSQGVNSPVTQPTSVQPAAREVSAQDALSTLLAQF